MLPTPTHTRVTSESPRAPVIVSIPVDEYTHLTLFHASPEPTTTFVQTGNPTMCLSTTSCDSVIDSGATNHMTKNTGILSSVSPYPNFPIVTTADGSSSPVMGNGIAQLSSSLSLPCLIST